MDGLENKRLYECEQIIERGLKTFVDVGGALLEIRDSRLYRADYGTFEEYCQQRWNFTRMRASQLIAAAEVIENIQFVNPGLQIPEYEKHTRPLTQLEPEQQYEAWRNVVETISDRNITAADVQKAVDEIRNKPHVSFNSGENEWYTPAKFIESARLVMGSIDTDPASSNLANKTVKAEIYYTEETDGLVQVWTGNVWMNPPYAQPLITEFSNRLVKKYNDGEFEQACILVNNATETQFYQLLMRCCSAICFIKGRVKFIDMDGVASGAPLQGQTIIYYGNKTKEFANEFQQYGQVLYA